MKKMRISAITIMIAGLLSPAAAQVDTTGLAAWTQIHNSPASWEDGAFGAYAQGHPDYGWGVYNSLTHNVTGDSLFVIKLLDGSFKKLWIVEKKSVLNRYAFRYADVDGSNEQEVDLATGDYAGKLFVNYSLSGDSIADIQPESNGWDLLLTKFHHPGMDYMVTGFLANEGVTVSVFNAADSATAADATMADTTVFTDSIAAIGNSWYKLKGMSMVPLDTIAYFVKPAGGDIYKLQVTYFESGFSGNGKIGIRKRKLSEPRDTSWYLDTLVMGPMYANEVYYKVDLHTRHKVSRDSWEIGFKTARFTSSVTANTPMGVELYAYPHADTAAWDPAASIDPAPTGGTAFSLYPVPAKDRLLIRMEQRAFQPVNITVFDMTGRQVLHHPVEEPGEGNPELDISFLSPGVYILQLRNGKALTSAMFTKRR
jgi:hypothetical protein